jgi:hypothetical protein
MISLVKYKTKRSLSFVLISIVFIFIDKPNQPQSVAPEVSTEKHFEVNTNLKPLFGGSEGNRIGIYQSVSLFFNSFIS